MTHDNEEPSAASAGSVADEPAAWGVLRVGGGWVSILANEVQAETSRKSWDAQENWVHEVVPLYRSPSLTDAERESVRFCAKFCGMGEREDLVATLRGLLERTK